jgi:hypothetical protein
MTKKIVMALLFLIAGNVLFAQTESDFEVDIKEAEGGIGRVTITKYTGRAASVSIPERLQGERVTTIGANAFNPSVSGGQAISSLTFSSGEGCLTIGENAFANNRLSLLVIPAGVRAIEAGAFRSNSISSLTLSDGVEVGAGAFANNRITTVKIGRDVTFSSDSIGFNFPAYYESLGSAAGTYIYRNGKWNTEQEIKGLDRIAELQRQLELEQNRQQELNRQLEQERQKQRDLQRQIDEAGEQPAPTPEPTSYSYGPDIDMKGHLGIGYAVEAGDLYSFGFNTHAGFSIIPGNLFGIGVLGGANLGLLLYESNFYFGYSLAGMVDLFLLNDWGEPGWGIAGGYGYQANFFDESDENSVKISDTFWRIGILKRSLYDEEGLSALLYVDLFNQIGWRIGFQMMTGF